MQHAATSTSKNLVSLFAIMIADFCNKIGTKLPFAAFKTTSAFWGTAF